MLVNQSKKIINIIENIILASIMAANFKGLEQ